MNDAIYSEEYKGHTIEIFPDLSSESPDYWGDDGAFLVCEHREMTVKRDGFDMDTVFRALHGAKDDDGEIDEEAEAVDGIDPEEWEREKTRKKLDELKRWEMGLSGKERDAVARSIKSIEKQLSILAGNK